MLTTPPPKHVPSGRCLRDELLHHRPGDIHPADTDAGPVRDVLAHAYAVCLHVRADFVQRLRHVDDIVSVGSVGSADRSADDSVSVGGVGGADRGADGRRSAGAIVAGAE